MTDGQNGRYSRQIAFEAIGLEGQKKLQKARVLIVGCGALGSAHANLLARAGVGFLRLLDRDFLNISNLQRQLLYDEKQVFDGLPKAIAAAKRIEEINSEITVEPIIMELRADNVEELIEDIDVVLDATDNFETRFLLNDACLKRGKPWIYGACAGSYGLTMNIIPGKTPCLRCLFESPEGGEPVPTCETVGIINPIVTVISSLQVTEAIKILLGEEEKLRKGVLSVDLWENQFNSLEILEPRVDCPACQERRWEYLDSPPEIGLVRRCSRTVQLTPSESKELDLAQIAQRLSERGDVTKNDYLVRCETSSFIFVVFSDGRAVIEGLEEASSAISIYEDFLGIQL